MDVDKMFDKLAQLRIDSSDTKVPDSDPNGLISTSLKTNPTSAKTKGTEEDSQDLLKCLVCYCQALDDINAELEALLKSRTELKTLQAVESVLRENRLEEKVQEADGDSVIPEEVKCPICFEIYSGEIWQCVNGHSVCGRCRGKLAACSECREGFRIAVRNRALESLLEGNKLKVDCPNLEYGCRERLRCREVQGHLKACCFGRKSEELLKVERDIGEIKQSIKMLEDRVETLNKKVMETGKRWNFVSTHYENRLMVIQAKSEHQVLKKEMEKCNLNIKIKSLVYFN